MYPASPAQFFLPFNLNWPILSIRWTQSRFILNEPITAVHSHSPTHSQSHTYSRNLTSESSVTWERKKTLNLTDPAQAQSDLISPAPAWILTSPVSHYSMDHKSTYKRFHKFLLKQQWFWDIIHKTLNELLRLSEDYSPDQFKSTLEPF